MKLRQPLTGSAEALFDYATDTPVIDTHEHIPRTETDYNNATIEFGHLFNPYVSNDLASAGMPFPRDVWAAFHKIEDDWDAFEPYWNAVKHGSYARPLRIALQQFYGVDDLTRENYREILARINENNTPGIYDRVFRQACGIERAIRCGGDLPEIDDPLLVGNITSPSLQIGSKDSLETMAEQVGAEGISGLDELIEVSDRWMEMQAANGAMEFKSFAMPVEEPTLRRRYRASWRARLCPVRRRPRSARTSERRMRGRRPNWTCPSPSTPASGTTSARSPWRT